MVEGEEEGFGVGGRGEDQGGGLGMEERRSGRDVGKGKDRESVWDPLDLGESVSRSIYVPSCAGATDTSLCVGEEIRREFQQD